MNRAAAVLAVLALLAAAPLGATSFVMMSDSELVDRTPLVVEARILSSDEAPAGGPPSTDYLIEVDRVLKGDLPGSNLVVRVPGGIGPDGIGLKIWGAPSFRAGERAVLFLRPSADGTFRVAQLMLGAFHEVQAGGETLLVRNLAEAHELAAPGEPADDPARYRQPRRRAAFLDWIAERAGGVEAAEDYFYRPAPGAPAVIVDGFTLFDDEDGFHLRWRMFDTGGVARWRVHEDGQPGLTLDQAITAFSRGMGAWSNDAGSNVNLGFLSPNTTTATGGLTTFDSQNVLLFEDPTNNPDFDGDFVCGSPGVLAIGGPWFQNTLHTFNGEQFRTIIGGDIITNKGLECFFNGFGSNRVNVAAELFGHELGHTLGIGHSCGDDNSPSCGNPVLNDALMRAFIHAGSRGPRLGSDDVEAVRTLYGDGTNPGPGPGTAPAAPTGLAAQLQGASSALLTWNDNSNDETGFRVQQKVGNGAFANRPDLPANAESLTVDGLVPSTTYTWQVRALGSGGTHSGFSNQVSLTTPAALPAAPSGLAATPIAPTIVLLDWEDESINETGFVIEASSPIELFHEVGTAGAGATSFAVGGLTTGRPYTFRVRARNGALLSAASNEASATPQSASTAPCAADADTLCLLAERFRIEVQWRDHINGGNGIGLVQPSPVGGSKTGVFSFFNPQNIELIVKALDGNPVNGNFWIFYGALSTVEYWVTVTDTATGDSNTYHNPPDELCGVPDTEAFPGLAAPVAASAAPRAAPLPAAAIPAAGSSVPCAPSATTLCLANGRFAVSVDWTDQRTLDSGSGTAVPGTERTGYFWFFNAENIELVVKILDATAISDNWWVFYGSLSDVQYTITVHDTVTSLEGSYVNDPGDFCGDADIDSFPDSIP